MAFPDFQAYNAIVYSLVDQRPQISHSTLVLAPIGSTLAKLEGQIIWHGGVVLDVWELVDFQAGRILRYSYEVYKQGEKIVWYDPFEHPREPSLASSFPHHKHVPPDINHHRVPAPGISFEQPNLPYLIEEIEREALSSVA